MAFQKLKTILSRNGYGKLTQELTQEQTIDMIKDEILDEDLDLSKSFEQNEQIIYNKFYDKNWVSIYTIFSKDDVRDLYGCVQELINK